MLVRHLISLAVCLLPVLACDGCYGPQEDVVLTRHVRRMQPEALNATTGPRAPLAWGQINFLHTTDTHGWLEGHIKEENYGADWGDFVAFTKQMRSLAQKRDVDLLLIDTGMPWPHRLYFCVLWQQQCLALKEVLTFSW